jgi:quinoprotein glucose dehydrogenase
MRGPSGVRIDVGAVAVVIGYLIATAGLGGLAAQTPGSPGDWTSHNYDLANRRYAPLDQINTDTVGNLRLAWSFPTRGTNVSQVTPLVVNGVMYFHSPSTFFALDAVTGRQLWTVPMESGAEGSGPVRGATYASRRVYAYRGATLYAMDAETGRPVESFGKKGVLSVVMEALRFKYPDRFPPTVDPVDLGYRLTTPPAHHDGTLYVAAALSEGHIPGGLVIATDAISGAIKWVFNTIPQQPGDEGWEIAKDTWATGARAGGGIWTQPAIDPELGMVYMNAGNPSPAYDGAARHGMNLFTNATLALDMKTGRLKWYYQAIHHDLWDWDHVTGPVLFDVTRDGRTIKGVGAAGKNCLLYLWHRETGAPIHPIVESVVPTETDVPAQKIWPTQPIPYNARGVPMTPFCATFVALRDPELAKQARPLYTPYSVREPYIVAHGGSSYGSPSFSPLTGLLYVTGKNGAISLKVKPLGDTLKPGPDSRGHSENFVELSRVSQGYTPTETVSAYDPSTGEQVWQQVVPAVSSIGSSGNLVTAGNVVFQGTGARAFYAFDARTGKQLFKYDAPRSIRASPLTYQLSGRQYVTVVATDTVLTFRLP